MERLVKTVSPKQAGNTVLLKRHALGYSPPLIVFNLLPIKKNMHILPAATMKAPKLILSLHMKRK